MKKCQECNETRNAEELYDTKICEKCEHSDEFYKLFEVVIQLGAILAVILLFFHKLNPFSPKKTQKQKMLTIQLWVKVIIGSIPAMLIGLPFNDFIEEKFNNSYVVAATLIIYGILFIVIENYQKDKQPKVEKLSQLTIQTVLIIGVFQALALIPGTSRSGATIVGALLIGVSRGVAAEFTFFLAVPVMFGASLLKGVKFLLHNSMTSQEGIILLVGMLVAFVVSLFVIRFLMGYIKKHDFKVFGWYRIVLGIIVLICGFVGVIG